MPSCFRMFAMVPRATLCPRLDIHREFVDSPNLDSRVPFEHYYFDLAGSTRPARSTLLTSIVFLGNQLPMPKPARFRLHDRCDLSRTRLPSCLALAGRRRCWSSFKRSRRPPSCSRRTGFLMNFEAVTDRILVACYSVLVAMLLRHNTTAIRANVLQPRSPHWSAPTLPAVGLKRFATGLVIAGP